MTFMLLVNSAVSTLSDPTLTSTTPTPSTRLTRPIGPTSIQMGNVSHTGKISDPSTPRTPYSVVGGVLSMKISRLGGSNISWTPLTEAAFRKTVVDASPRWVVLNEIKVLSVTHSPNSALNSSFESRSHNRVNRTSSGLTIWFRLSLEVWDTTLVDGQAAEAATYLARTIVRMINNPINRAEALTAAEDLVKATTNGIAESVHANEALRAFSEINNKFRADDYPEVKYDASTITLKVRYRSNPRAPQDHHLAAHHKRTLIDLGSGVSTDNIEMNRFTVGIIIIGGIVALLCCCGLVRITIICISEHRRDASFSQRMHNFVKQDELKRAERAKQNKAASRVQAMIRGKNGRDKAAVQKENIEISRNAAVALAAILFAEKTTAVRKLQARWRGLRGRSDARNYQEEVSKSQNNAATMLQTKMRGSLASKAVAKKRQEKFTETEEKAAWERAKLAALEAEEIAAQIALLPSFAEWGAQRTGASSKIQAISRGRAGRQRAAAIAAGKMTPAWPDPAAKLEKQKMRARKARAEALKNMTYKEYMAEKSEAVKVVQRQVRVVLAKAAVRRRKAYLVSVHAATALQRMQRGVLGRKRRAIKEAERELQRRERMVRAAELAAARKLQAVLIGREVRARFARARAAARAAGSEVPGALRGPTPAGMGKARARAAAAARRALGRLAQVPTAGTGALLAGADLPTEESQQPNAALTARSAWKYLEFAGQTKVVDVETPLPPAIVDEESESNGLTSNPLLAMDSLGAPPSKFQPALSDSARPLPKANRPIVELVGLRSGNARGNPEMRGNRAVGELLKVHPSDEWYPVRLIISGKRIKV